jgi:TRAP-type C4-dicarboxylate transport system substrate-binding protein
MFSNDFPRYNATSLPPGVELPTTKDWIAAHEMTWEYYNMFPEVQAECKDFKLLWPDMLAPVYLMCRDKEVHYPTDFKGMKIGAGGPSADMVSAYGGAPVHQVPPECYMNMDKGVVEAAFLSWAMASDWKIEELAKYYYTQGFGNGTLFIGMNLEAWNEMTAEDQKIMEATMLEAAHGPLVEGMLAEEEHGRQIAEANAKVYAPTPEERAAWEEACKPAIDEWAKTAESLGVQNPMRFYNAFKELQKKYFPE